MNRHIIILTALLALAGCAKNDWAMFDTPYARIKDESLLVSQMTIDKEANNLLTSLSVILSASDNYFSDEISINYELVVGNGLKEGVDFKIQPSTKSPLTFEKGTYQRPIRILWYRNPDFDPSKDATLTIKLVSSNVPEMVFGFPGPDKKDSEFIFTKL